jgi:hypothetical protein
MLGRESRAAAPNRSEHLELNSGRGKHVPPPQNFPSLLPRGDEATCHQRLGTGGKDLNITRYLYPFEYPSPPAKSWTSSSSITADQPRPSIAQ